jgi:hypothetical protein
MSAEKHEGRAADQNCSASTPQPSTESEDSNIMRTLYCDFHPDTLQFATDDDLKALLAETAGTLMDDAAFIETHLQHDQPAWIEALEDMTPLELCSLCQQISMLLRLRHELEDPDGDFAFVETIEALQDAARVLEAA